MLETLTGYPKLKYDELLLDLYNVEHVERVFYADAKLFGDKRFQEIKDYGRKKDLKPNLKKNSQLI